MVEPSDSGRSNLLVVVLALLVGLAAGLGVAVVLGGGEDEPTASEQAGATSGQTRDGDAEAAADLPAPDEGIAPADATDPETALRGFLAAEVARDFDLSYDFLAEGVRTTLYTPPALWVNAHADIPTVTGYRIDDVDVVDDDTARIDTLTGFEPMLDPVIGLVAARGRTTWTLVRDAEGLWGVDTNATENRPLYPSSDGVEEAARRWVDLRVECGDTTDLEADLVGTPAVAQDLCGVDQPDPVELGAARSLVDADGTTALLSEFGPEVFAWARVVPVGAETPFNLVLGPIGDTWQVVGVLART